MSVATIVAVIVTNLWLGGQRRAGFTLSVNDGAMVSTTPTDCVSVPALPLASVAVQVTIVVPSGKDAGASFPTTGAASHTSDTVGVPRSGEAPEGEVHSTPTRSGGATISGSTVSETATCAAHRPSLPLASVAVKPTAVLPRGNSGGASFVRTGWRSQSSLAEAPEKNEASCGSAWGVPPVAEHSTDASAGHKAIGEVPSTRNEPIRVLHPAVLVAA